ncbi:hypothetical protein ACOMHN_033615 [Nucella lapillus]
MGSVGGLGPHSQASSTAYHGLSGRTGTTQSGIVHCLPWAQWEDWDHTVRHRPLLAMGSVGGLGPHSQASSTACHGLSGRTGTTQSGIVHCLPWAQWEDWDHTVRHRPLLTMGSVGGLGPHSQASSTACHGLSERTGTTQSGIVHCLPWAQWEDWYHTVRHRPLLTMGSVGGLVPHSQASSTAYHGLSGRTGTTQSGIVHFTTDA